jgi:hypothetical protein
LDRLASALFGAIFGAVYGLILAIGVGYFTDGEFHLDLFWNTVAVFAGLGLILGPLVGDVIGSLLHFLLGVFAGIFSGGAGGVVDPEPRASGWLRTLFVIGLGTGIAIYFSWRYR